MYVRIQNVDDVNRSGVLDGVVEVLNKCLAKTELVPMVGITDNLLDFVEVAEADRFVDEAGILVTCNEVDRSYAYVQEDGVRLCCSYRLGFDDLALDLTISP